MASFSQISSTIDTSTNQLSAQELKKLAELVINVSTKPTNPKWGESELQSLGALIAIKIKEQQIR